MATGHLAYHAVAVNRAHHCEASPRREASLGISG